MCQQCQSSSCNLTCQLAFFTKMNKAGLQQKSFRSRPTLLIEMFGILPLSPTRASLTGGQRSNGDKSKPLSSPTPHPALLKLHPPLFEHVSPISVGHTGHRGWWSAIALSQIIWTSQKAIRWGVVVQLNVSNNRRKHRTSWIPEFARQHQQRAEQTDREEISIPPTVLYHISKC